MNTPPRYSIIEQFTITVRGEQETVSRLHGQKWHCTCPDCNLGYCDDDCQHVKMAIRDGEPVELFLTAIAKANWKTTGRNEARRLAKILPWETPPKKKKIGQKLQVVKAKYGCPSSPARGPVLGNAYR